MKTISMNARKAASTFAIILCALMTWPVCADAQTDPLDVWHQRTNPSGSGLTGIAYGNGQFVAVGNNGLLMVSPDGSAWTQYITQPIINYGGIFFGDGAFYAFGYYASPSFTNCILRSLNGTTWTKVYEFIAPQSGTGYLKAGAYGDNRLVFVGSDRIITASIGMTNWTQLQLPSATPLTGVTYGAGRFAASGYYPSVPKAFILSSVDGLVWRYDYGPKTDFAATGIVYANGVFVAAWRTNNAPDGGVLISTNLSSWDFVPIAGIGNAPFGQIVFGGGQFIATFGSGTFAVTSPDGLIWTNRWIQELGPVAYGQGTFVGAHYGIFISQSDVFGSLTSSTPSNLALKLYAGVTVTGTEGKPYRIEYTTNSAPGATWLLLTNFTLPYSPYLWIDPAAPIQPQRFYRAVQLE